MAPEMLASFHHLKRLIAQEDLINLVCRKSYRSYNIKSDLTETGLEGLDWIMWLRIGICGGLM